MACRRIRTGEIQDEVGGVQAVMGAFEIGDIIDVPNTKGTRMLEAAAKVVGVKDDCGEAILTCSAEGPYRGTQIFKIEAVLCVNWSRPAATSGFPNAR